MTRMFVAVVPPENVIEDLEEFLASRRETAPFRWSAPEQWHLTLAFAAQVPDRAYDDLVARLARAAAKRSPMEARIAGGGAFPNVGRARVLFAGVETEAEELRRAATGARAALAKAGAEVDGQRFRPHLTLARMGRPVEAPKWVRLLEGYAGPTWTIEEIALIASHLGEGPRGRPRHEVVETFSLGRAGSGPGRPAAPPSGR
jgi:2'-5' RNA ligase